MKKQEEATKQNAGGGCGGSGRGNSGRSRGPAAVGTKTSVVGQLSTCGNDDTVRFVDGTETNNNINNGSDIYMNAFLKTLLGAFTYTDSIGSVHCCLSIAQHTCVPFGL